MLNNKKLLISDMDGTLLNNQHMISDENYCAIKEFIDNGGLFTVATGRMKTTVMPYLPRLPVNSPAILYNGAAIYDFKDRQMLYENHLPQEESLEFITEISGKFPDAGIEIFHGDAIYLVNENNETIRHFKREGIVSHEADLKEIPLKWFKMIIVWEPYKLRTVEEYLDRIGFAKNYRGLRYTYSEPQFIEILKAGCSKGTALEELMKIIDIDPENVIAVGDNLNDMELLKIAGTGIAVENAHPELKKHADELTVKNDNHAVSSVIKKILDDNDTIKAS